MFFNLGNYRVSCLFIMIEPFVMLKLYFSYGQNFIFQKIILYIKDKIDRFDHFYVYNLYSYHL